MPVGALWRAERTANSGGRREDNAWRIAYGLVVHAVDLQRAHRLLGDLLRDARVLRHELHGLRARDTAHSYWHECNAREFPAPAPSEVPDAK